MELVGILRETIRKQRPASEQLGHYKRIAGHNQRVLLRQIQNDAKYVEECVLLIDECRIQSNNELFKLTGSCSGRF